MVVQEDHEYINKFLYTSCVETSLPGSMTLLSALYCVVRERFLLVYKLRSIFQILNRNMRHNRSSIETARKNDEEPIARSSTYE